ncbi:hypothetical protein AVEN_231036-1 [Araneus ventricosus]|uniref:Uncharacterized protein n=1 Tax=Araneus ventricosus TaxID=182803 RepID=A0A4Y2A3N3_ARAVE|nr:hypothetical protein AVEN_231036-1 [Araneus ventricosus]
MDKWLKTGTLKRSTSRTETRTTDLAAMEITGNHRDYNREVQRPTDWPVQKIIPCCFNRYFPIDCETSFLNPFLLTANDQQWLAALSLLINDRLVGPPSWNCAERQDNSTKGSEATQFTL